MLRDSSDGFAIAEEDLRLREYVATLDFAALTERLASGEDFAPARWLIIAHIVNHGTQHRAEASALLTSEGRSPGELDLMNYAEDRAAGGSTEP